MVRLKVDTLTKSALIEINKKFSNGRLRSEAELDFIVYKVEKTRGINKKVATLLLELARRHAFEDGNKRTAYEAALTLLKLNGKILEVGERSKFNVVFWTVKQRTNLEEIVQWIENHTRS